MSDVSVTGATYDGIDIVAHADGVGSSVHQYGQILNSTASDTTLGNGVYAYAEATYGGTAIAHLYISGLTATHNYFDGVYTGVSASSSTADASVAAQYVTVKNSNLAGNFVGFDAAASGTGNATARQDIYVGNTILSDAAHASPGYQFDGASVSAFAFDEGSVQQTAYFVGDTATYNTGNGLAVTANSLYAGFVEQTVTVYGSSSHYSEFSHNGGYGISVDANASAGGDIEQNFNLYYANVNSNGLGGLSVTSNSYGIAVGYSLYYSHISQNTIAYHAHFRQQHRQWRRVGQQLRRLWRGYRPVRLYRGLNRQPQYGRRPEREVDRHGRKRLRLCARHKSHFRYLCLQQHARP